MGRAKLLEGLTLYLIVSDHPGLSKARSRFLHAAVLFINRTDSNGESSDVSGNGLGPLLARCCQAISSSNGNELPKAICECLMPHVSEKRVISLDE